MCARELDTDAFGSDAPVFDDVNENQIVDTGLAFLQPLSLQKLSQQEMLIGLM